MSCCICGTVRNCGNYLDKIFQNMERIGTIFKNYKIYLYYDKSDDNTLNKLTEYKNKNKNFEYYVNDNLLAERTYRIAMGRNKCLEYIKNECKDYEYFIMMDCDDRCAKDIKLNVLKYYLSNGNWDCLTFDHPDGYYDTWALSIYPYVLSCHHFSNHSEGQKLVQRLIYKCPKNKLIPCYSAFNGFGIYRKNKFINCKYDGRFRTDYIPKRIIYENLKRVGKMNQNLKHIDCEHRSFHFEAIFKNRARIRISPLKLFI